MIYHSSLIYQVSVLLRYPELIHSFIAFPFPQNPMPLSRADLNCCSLPKIRHCRKYSAYLESDLGVAPRPPLLTKSNLFRNPNMVFNSIFLCTATTRSLFPVAPGLQIPRSTETESLIDFCTLSICSNWAPPPANFIVRYKKLDWTDFGCWVFLVECDRKIKVHSTDHNLKYNQTTHQ